MSLKGKLKSKELYDLAVGRHADGGGLYVVVEATADNLPTTRTYQFRFTSAGGARPMFVFAKIRAA
jgi:hypothetical protein